jgi:hypothetical protein
MKNPKDFLDHLRQIAEDMTEDQKGRYTTYFVGEFSGAVVPLHRCDNLGCHFANIVSMSKNLGKDLVLRSTMIVDSTDNSRCLDFTAKETGEVFRWAKADEWQATPNSTTIHCVGGDKEIKKTDDDTEDTPIPQAILNRLRPSVN